MEPWLSSPDSGKLRLSFEQGEQSLETANKTMLTGAT